MQILLQRTESNKLNKGNSNEEVTYKFCNVENGLCWFDLGDSYEPAGMKIVGARPREVYFSFTVKEIVNDSVVLEVGGAAGGGPKKDDHNYFPKVIKINLNESKSFATKTRYGAIVYTILLSNEDEKIERMGLAKFNILCRYCGYLDRVEASIYAPLIYSLEDKYYNAAVNYLQNGLITQLRVGEFYSILDILSGYGRDRIGSKKFYLEALIILSHIEKYEEDAHYIYRPDLIL